MDKNINRKPNDCVKPTVCDYGMNPSEKAYKCAHDEQCDECYGKDMEKCPQRKGYTKCDRCATACYCSVERGIECGYKCDCHNPLPQQGENHAHLSAEVPCGVCKPKSPSTDWEVEFDEKFYEGDSNSTHCREHRVYASPFEIKVFIRTLLAEVERTAVRKCLEGVKEALPRKQEGGDEFELGSENATPRDMRRFGYNHCASVAHEILDEAMREVGIEI